MIALPSMCGDLSTVVRRLVEWADALDLPRHDEPGVVLEISPPPPRGTGYIVAEFLL